jgi:hypothetical protein
MVLLLAIRRGRISYEPECFVDLPLDVALKYESDIATELMRYDDEVSDVIVYSKKSFNKDSIPSSLDNIVLWYNTWSFTMPTLNGVHHD